MSAPARYWEPVADAALCHLCPHHCRIEPGHVGACGVRRQTADGLITDVWGRVATAQPSPIERKFLYHVAPGAVTFSYAPPGCNMRCRFCQNWIVSQAPKRETPELPGTPLSPDELVAQARAAGCEVVAATYTEPTIFLEYALDVARAAKDHGLLNVWKTNGFITPAPQAEAAALLDAVNVDLKAWDPHVHQTLTGADLPPILDAIRRYRDAGVWLELTTLVIPTVNDDDHQMRMMRELILTELGPDTPWHLTRFHPDFDLRHLSPTPPETLHRLRDEAMAAGLNYVYTDVEPKGRGWDTACVGCGEVLLERAQYRLTANHLLNGNCLRCGTRLPGATSSAATPSPRNI